MKTNTELIMNHYSEQVNNRSNYRKTLGDKHLEPSVMKLDSQCQHKTGLLAFHWTETPVQVHYYDTKMTPKWRENVASRCMKFDVNGFLINTMNDKKMTQKWQSKPFQLPTECLENDTKMTLNDTEMTKNFDVNGFLINAMNDTKMTAIFTF